MGNWTVKGSVTLMLSMFSVALAYSKFQS